MFHRPVLGERALREPFIVDDTELLQVLADVVQDGVEPGVEHPPVVLPPKQALDAGDHAVDMGFLVAACRFIRRDAGKDLGARMAQALAVFTVEGGADVPDVVALVAVRRKRHVLSAQFEVA